MTALAPARPVRDEGREREPHDARQEVVPLRVVRERHWGRWIAAAVIGFLLLQLAWTFVSNPRYEWGVVAATLFDGAVLRGVGLTLLLTAAAAVVGFALGAVLAVARMSDSALLRSAAWGYIWFFRSVPLVVQLVVWYNLGYLFPTLGIGWPFTDDFWIAEFDTVTLVSQLAAAILGLGLHQAAFSAEVIRGGLLSVDAGQREAAAALGIPRAVRFFRIVLPQAARSIVPNAANEIISLVKGTSVVFVVALPELFYAVQVIYNRNGRVIPLLLVSVVWYVLLTTLLSLVQQQLERHVGRGAERERSVGAGERARAWLVAQWRRLGDEPADPTAHAGRPVDWDRAAARAAGTATR